jgi:hypothetical protein
MFIQQHNCETGEITQKELTAKQIKDRQDQHNAEVAANEAREAQRQAILDRLGLTADEAQLLLG